METPSIRGKEIRNPLPNNSTSSVEDCHDIPGLRVCQQDLNCSARAKSLRFVRSFVLAEVICLFQIGTEEWKALSGTSCGDFCGEYLLLSTCRRLYADP